MAKFRRVVFAEVPQFVRVSVDRLLEREGPYSNDRDDHKTVWGIRQATADMVGWPGRLEDIERDDAARIWIYHWFYEPRFDLVARHSVAVCNQIMDTAGPAGRSIGVKHLQRALNHFNGPPSDRTGKLPYGPDLEDDGKIGPKTADMLREFLKHRGKQGERVLFVNINSQQEVHFMATTKANPGKRRFSWGWSLKRVFADLRRLFNGETPIDNIPEQEDLAA